MLEKQSWTSVISRTDVDGKSSEFINIVARDNKQQTVGLSWILVKHLICFNHDILIKKLKDFGIRELAGKWFTLYLSDRKQLVQIESVRSNITHIKRGVPQGSILGPVLLFLNINNLTLNTPQANAVLFADDTNSIFNEYRKKIIRNRNVMKQQIY